MKLGPPSSRLRELLLSYLSFSPDFGYVQAAGALPISVCLTPRPDMAERMARYLVGPPEEVRRAGALLDARGQAGGNGRNCHRGACLLC